MGIRWLLDYEVVHDFKDMRMDRLVCFLYARHRRLSTCVEIVLILGLRFSGCCVVLDQSVG